MSATVFVEKEAPGHLRLVNDTGADLAAEEFAVVGGIACVADEAIASAAVGSFHTEEGIVVQINTFVTSEGTFGTANAKVYWDPTSKKFSDTKTIGYIEVGTVAEILSGGVVRMVKYFRSKAVETFAALADVDVADVTDNDTLKYVASTGKWTDVAV